MQETKRIEKMLKAKEEYR